MKIIYNENPLNTVIELDEHEKKELWYKIKVEQMEWLLFGAHFHLTRKGYTRWEKIKRWFGPDLNRVLQEVDPDYYFADPRGSKSKLDVRVDLIYKELTEQLVGSHCGDCRCVAMSCDKCHAEGHLGIDTIKGLRKQQASKIFGAFGESHKNKWTVQRSIHEAIEYLENYEPTATWDGYESEVPRWKQEAADAAEWLKIYRNQHFVDPT